jgi:hypothetical protein
MVPEAVAPAQAAPGPARGGCGMPGSAKSMVILTVAALVLVTAYTVALGSSGWLWFGWVVLGLVTIGVAATDHHTHGA